ncbi:MAG: TetR/AcrR family transcriptional regulator [Clostridiales bacterium]|nr:TetR/AcrR family transcriptional regulator [Clostridiales bacterium]
MKTQRGIDTHNAIVSAAAELFEKKSVHKITVSDIVKKAGVAKGTFYIHFESKDELVWHFLEHELDSAFVWFDKLIGKGYDKESIEEIIDTGVAYLEKRMFTLKMIHNVKFHSFLGQNKMKERFEEEWINPMILWLDAGNRKGVITVDDPKFTARFLSMAVHEMIDQIIIGESEYTLRELGDKVKLMLLKLIA